VLRAGLTPAGSYRTCVGPGQNARSGYGQVLVPDNRDRAALKRSRPTIASASGKPSSSVRDLPIKWAVRDISGPKKVMYLEFVFSPAAPCRSAWSRLAEFHSIFVTIGRTYE
jgi:hypothetical protein